MSRHVIVECDICHTRAFLTKPGPSELPGWRRTIPTKYAADGVPIARIHDNRPDFDYCPDCVAEINLATQASMLPGS
jgi:hypothetical protein